MRDDWFVFVVSGSAVAASVYGCIAWCLVAYRRRAGRAAARFSGNPALEIFYVSLSLLVVVALFIVTYRYEFPVDRLAARPQNRIGVTAFRWSWRFDYGSASLAGTPARPPTLYLPVSQVTQIDLRSADVTHSFWVPALLFKRDAIPGMTNSFDLAPTRTGTYLGRCAQFCGIDHALMTFVVKVVPQNEYLDDVKTETQDR